METTSDSKRLARKPDLCQSRYLSLLAPMIYVAWADGDLTDEEIERIRTETDQQAWLDADAKDILATWLDPDSPPSPVDMKNLLAPIREAGNNLPEPDRQSLIDLGVEIAGLEQSEASREADWLNDDIRSALDKLENSLGLHSYDACSQLLARDFDRAKKPVSEPAPEFSIDSMESFLDGQYRETRQKVRDILKRKEFEYVYDSTKEHKREQVTEWLQLLADEELGGLAYPNASGDGDMGKFTTVFETLAMFDQSLVVKFGVQFGLFGGSIQFLGSDRHREAYLEDIANLELLGGFAMSERGHGSNVRNLETRAIYDRDADEFIIDTPSESAKKVYIGNAARDGRMFTVFAQLEVGSETYGVHPFLVQARDSNGDIKDSVTIEDSGHKMGLNGVDNGRLSFDETRIPRSQMLDRHGWIDDEGEYNSPIPSDTKRFFTMIGTLVGGRVSVAAASLTAMKTALTIAVRYGAIRRQFGPAGQPENSILNYRSHKKRLLPRVAEAYALNAATQYVRQRYLDRSEDDSREVEALAAGMKAYASWRAVDAVQTAREACGGEGYMSRNRISELRKDIDIYTTFEGDNTVLMLLVARGLLDNFRKQFQDEQLFSMLQYVAGQASTAVQELNPVTTRKTDRDHLRSSDFQLSAFKYREQRLLQTSAQRIKTQINDGESAFDAFSHIQDHLLSLSNAHIERVVLEQFIERNKDADNSGLEPWLEKLRSLFALSRLYDDAHWFLESSYLEINILCDELRPQAVHLVDAFGIPDNCLSAPIAFPDTPV